MRWWGSPFEVPPEHYDGVVLVGGTELAAPYWGWQAMNPYSGFLAAKPVANIGGSILVYEGSADLRPAAAVAHMFKAWDYIGSGDQEPAIQEALKAEDLAPEHPCPPYILGIVLARAKRTEAARIQFETSLKLAEAARPEYQELWVTAAKAQLAILP